MDIKNSEYFIGTELQWETFGDGISRQILGYDNHLMMVKLKFSTGADNCFQSSQKRYLKGTKPFYISFITRFWL